MGKHDEYLSTSLWYRERINNPYQVIAAFFSATDIASYRNTIRRVVQVVYSNQIWKKNNPVDLLYEFKFFESVINAAYLINKKKKDCHLSIGHKDVFNPSLFVGWHANNAEWGVFPRLLTFKEFSNPYLVFKRFFKYAEISQWKQDLNCLLDYSLSTMSLHDAGIKMDTFNMYLHLTKLVEAAHLINTRENNYVRGYTKNKVKTN